MSIEPIGLLFLVLGILILIRGPIFGIYLLVPTMVMGSCAAMIVSNATIQPAHLLLGFTSIALFSRPGTWSFVLSRMAFPREGFWFVATAVIGIVGAFILPRLFAGAAYVVAVGATSDGGASLILVPLAPTTGNLTQSIYFVGDIVFFLVCYVVAMTKPGLQALTNAILIFCGLNIFFAFVDLATYWSGTAFLLDFMRNSTYGIQDEVVINGLKRINGSFTEASAFATASLWCGCFAFRLWLGGIHPRLTFSLALSNMLLVVFAVSSTGYVVLPLMLGIIYMASLLRFVLGETMPKSVYAYLALAPLLLMVIMAIVLLTPALGGPITDMIQDMVLNKGNSASAAERGMWNQTALNAFFATYGMGAGIGTVRASSFTLAVLANLGALGSLTYGIFILMALFKPAERRLDWATAQIRSAARVSCLVALIMNTISGTLVDLLLPFYMLAAIACAAGDFQSAPRLDETADNQAAVPLSLGASKRTAMVGTNGDGWQ